MAVGKLFTILVVAAIAFGDHEIQTEDKEKKALASEKGQKYRSANPAKDRGSFHKLTALLNRTTEDRQNRRKNGEKSSVSQLHLMNRNYNDMMNDNEGIIAINSKPSGNDTADNKIKKIMSLRPTVPMYETVHKNNFLSQATGVFCNFENVTYDEDVCMWQWNATVSSHGLGFRVMTGADLVEMNQTTRGMKFTGPATDADGNPEGNFLYLAVDPTMENMVIKSPPFQGLWDFCKFEVMLHQSKMQNASIRLIFESTESHVQWVLQEITGNNNGKWYPMYLSIGKVLQEVQIIMEVTRPSYVSLSQPLPHIAIDNIRMSECVPEPPVHPNGSCVPGQMKCMIMNRDSCIKLHQVCDLVRDCDDGSDENQNCDKMPYGSYCNFELDKCGFENVSTAQSFLKWSRHNGPTPTDKTGPNFDHTCGPAHANPAVVVPLLLPSHMNFPISQCVGYYFFVNMNVTGPNQEQPDFASTAVMRTAIFNPPPKVHGNITSRYYNCCIIRFYYQQNGRNYGSLSLNVVETTIRGNITTALWFSTKDKGENWYRASIILPNITSRYYLEFKTRRGMRMYSDSAIDDFSLAPECFGLNVDPEELGDYNYYDPKFGENTTPHEAFADRTYYRFTTCGATGRSGPTQNDCDEAYNNTPVAVTVVENPPYQGIQVWEVPAEGLYTMVATGASGGLGSAWAGVSHAASVRVLVELHKAERIYILVGQQGLNACKKTLSGVESPACARKPGNTTLQFHSKTHEVRNTTVADGGGGGGGATYVFLVDKDGQAVPLIVAGGGGGISVGRFKDDGSQYARALTNSTPKSGYMYGSPGKTSGAGGGWIGHSGPTTPGFELVRGAALLEGGMGGAACSGEAHGGFGGGGGGCLKGGGGGGWIGGNTADSAGNHGNGGWSYVASNRVIREYSRAAVLPRTGPGELVVIQAVPDCNCDYRCVALNEYRSEVQCYCPSTWTTDANDPTKCIMEGAWARPTWGLIIALSVAVLVCALAVLCVCLFLYNSYQRRKEAEQQEKIRTEQDVALFSLRNSAGDSLNMAFNPHYGSETILPQGIDIRGLPQVSRESLKLVKALGQGAFGEVYQGLYRHRAGDTVEMPVAVKTLPELSTGQAESDFLMEAAIMAKFNHPNIVHLIGVCFDRHPRFIVLELLAGGDLKNFLRESRPRPERVSALTMKDLLLCSVDVCKGCRYLESKRFIHRDIAARNCLLTSRGPGRVVKIADFGMARDIYRSDYYKKGGKAMLPIKWMPPEAYIDGVFTIKTDVWSFGVLIWEVFSLGVMPYTGCANREVMELVTGGGRLEKPYGCPQEIYRMMCECWNPNPSDRPAFQTMFDMLQSFLQDASIVNVPLPVVHSLLPLTADVHYHANGPRRAPAGDYLVPNSPQDSTPASTSSMDQLVLHSKSPTAVQDRPEIEDSQSQPLLKASQEYGNIPIVSRSRSGSAKRDALATSSGETRTNTKFLQSNSTDRLLSSVEVGSLDDDTASEPDERAVVWETSFIKPKPKPEPRPIIENGPVVEKLISITPTSPKPPANVLSLAIESNVVDKTNYKNTLIPECKTAPLNSPDPPRTNAWAKDIPPKYAPKPKPLCLDAAQLEQNLNALKKNSGSVNLTTMNIVPPYINVVTPNKLSESKTIQIDPKKAVIDDLPKENQPKEEKATLKQSNSAASLLNGPMTDVPYADSDNASLSSGSNPLSKKYDEMNIIVMKQGSNGEYVGESEISC